MIGRILGNRYELIRELGSGGMAWVYLADDLAPGADSPTHRGRRVAVKILYPQLANDADFLHRFMQEARLLVSLGEGEGTVEPAGAAPGPNGNEQGSAIVPVLDYGADRDTHYLVMEYVPGRDLRGVLEEEGPLEWRRALGISRQVAAALGRADSHGVVHRDVKPGNIMLVPGDRVRVLDFGVARARSSPTLTHSGFVG
ncbi:MAG TPA: protein kinase, partial [Anaerolineae bacterium]|nr:protein kinase [Anaerolineae bacterium]